MQMIRYPVVFIFVLLFTISACSRNPSGRDVFQMAATAAKSAKPETRWYIFGEIAKAEAEHGHYDDALRGWNLTDKFPDQLYADLVAIRARNGDLAGAKKLADMAADGNAKQLSLYAIALVQAERGDTDGARVNIRSLLPQLQEKVLEAVATQQARSGDLDSALNTVSEIEPAWRDGILFAIANQLAERGNKTRAREIAMRMADRNWARSVGRSPSDPCDLATQVSESGNLAEDLKRLNAANCDCKTVAYIHEKSGDLLGAEKAMQACVNPVEVSAGMAELAMRSAAKGNIDAALKFSEAVHVPGAEFEEHYLTPVFRAIGRNWALKDRTAALRWAEARPDGDQRAMALLGVAEAINP